MVVAKKSALKDLFKANKAHLNEEINIQSMIDAHLVKNHLERLARPSSHFHPSQISKGIECERYYFYMFTDPEVDLSWLKKEAFPARTLRIMEVGTGIHYQFHRLFYEMGILEGVWQCCYCDQKFWATSPHECPDCKRTVNWDHLIFKEIPFESTFIMGHADGILNLHPTRFLLEMKSIKNILDKNASAHTYGFESLVAPIDEHLTQLQLYFSAWNEKVKESANEEKLVAFADSGYLRLPNNSPDIIGAREIGTLEKGLVVYIGKNNSEIKNYVTHYNPSSISYLKNNMATIFEKIAAGDIDKTEKKWYTGSSCHSSCRYGKECPGNGV